MKLNDWLRENAITQAEFAKRCDTNKSTITRLINGDQWLSRGLAELIVRETNGEVTANDFMLTEQHTR